MDATLLLEDIQKRRGEDIFSPVNCVLGPAEGLGVFGYNGSGKTTLLDMIAGIERPTAGRCVAHGSVGYVMQHAGFQESLSFKDTLLTEAYLCGLRGSQATEQVRLVAARLELLPFWNKRLAKGSSGMRGRLSVAAALLASPHILLLDEAFNFLDEQSVTQTRHVLFAEKERGATLVMVSHDRRDFEGLCERVLTLPDATIAAL
jgi:ABC-type multidrug transport system ATPase subunit